MGETPQTSPLESLLHRTLVHVSRPDPDWSSWLVDASQALRSWVPGVEGILAEVTKQPRGLRSLAESAHDPLFPKDLVFLREQIPGWDRGAEVPTITEAASSLIPELDLVGRGVGFLTVIPLLAGGQVRGAWILASAQHPGFQPEDRALLIHIGTVLALAWRPRLGVEELQKHRDEWTHAAKLAAVGTLVAGVAHELGGPLQAIVSLSELLIRDPQFHERVDAAHRILRSALRCRGMVQDLLTYARKHPHGCEPVQVSHAVMDAVELDRYADVGDIQVEFQTVGDPPPVLGNGPRLTQVFLNLITNARHATAGLDRGRVAIVIDVVSSENSRLSLPPRTPVVRVVVEDNGPGVPASMAPRIFEPFFTTKDPGSGTGLGLSVSRSLVQDMGGDLYLDQTSPGRGARFVVELPAEPTAAPSVERSHLDAPGPGGGPARILLVDDDQELLATYAAILSLDGHQTTAVDRARAARELIDQGNPFDVVICDVRLPDLSGREFYEDLRRRHPQLASRVIFATGDVVNDETRAFLAGIPNPALVKPFQIEDLTRAIEHMLGRRQSGTGNRA